MGAVIYCIDMGTQFHESYLHFIVEDMDIVFCVHAFCDTGLVCDNDDGETIIFEESDCLCRTGDERELVDPVCIVGGVGCDDTVTIEINNFRHIILAFNAGIILSFTSGPQFFQPS